MSSQTWIPFFRELATKLLGWRDRQPELLALLRAIGKSRVPMLNLEDKTTTGAQPLDVIDPFTFFAAFCRTIRDDNRAAIVAQVKPYLGVEAALPTDFDGFPVVDNQASWFFPHSRDGRQPDDIPSLWDLFAQAVEHGPSGVNPATFERCLNVKGVGLAKLTIALFWVRPDAFLPLDRLTREHLDRAGITVPTRVDWGAYIKLLERVRTTVGSDPAAISNAAFTATFTSPATLSHAAHQTDVDAPANSHYWAGGHMYGNESQVERFKREGRWEIGWAKDAQTRGARGAWSRIARISPGDLFAIKGYGGRNNLRVYVVGRVKTVDADKGFLTFEPQDRPLFRDKAPQGPGDGTWFETLTEVTSEAAISAIFGGEQPPPPPSHPTLPLNLILYGPPGTGKTWRLRNELLGEFGDGATRAASFVTFHPSFTYEDFVEGLRPESDAGNDAVIRYPMRPGVFKQACEAAIERTGYSLAALCALAPDARQALLADAPPVAICIDEINRGNVARVFGELITLLEPDKRLGEENELIVTLPGSRERFGVPPNLWVIGTMNTADRSVVALDTALRRRFAFEECPPRPELLHDVEVEGVNLETLLTTINRRLERLRDRDHLIGHAFFMDLADNPELRTIERLREVFGQQLIPLLQEYFYADLGRIGLVLGPAFVQLERLGGELFARRFDHDQRDDLAERPVWRLANIDDLDAAAFRGIYG